MLAKETKTPDFRIDSDEKLSSMYRDLGIVTFKAAGKYVAELPYERNSDKLDTLCVMKDKKGTCGTKHATLLTLAEENKFRDFQLMIGLFKMNGANTPKVAGTLKKFDLDYVPEAHNYLKYKGEILDYTGNGFSPERYRGDLIEEVEIRPEQIADFKVAYQKEFIRTWLLDHKEIPYALEELWEIRERCIRDLYS